MLEEYSSCRGYEHFQGQIREIPDDDIKPVRVFLKVINNEVSDVGCPHFIPGNLCNRPWNEELYKRGRSSLAVPCRMYTTRAQLPLLIEPFNKDDSEAAPFVASNPVTNDILPLIVESEIPIASDPVSEPARDISPPTEINPLELTLGITHYPFIGAKEFCKVDWEKVEEMTEDEYETALDRELLIEGVSGWIELIPFFTEDVDEIKEAEKPLGPVQVTHEYGESDEEDQLILSPLQFQVRFDAKSFDEFQSLRDYMLQIRCNRRFYYLNCYGSDDEVDDIDEDCFTDGEPLVLTDSNIVDAKAEDTSVLLPWNLDKISGIGIRLITIEDYNRLI